MLPVRLTALQGWFGRGEQKQHGLAETAGVATVSTSAAAAGTLRRTQVTTPARQGTSAPVSSGVGVPALVDGSSLVPSRGALYTRRGGQAEKLAEQAQIAAPAGRRDAVSREVPGWPAVTPAHPSDAAEPGGVAGLAQKEEAGFGEEVERARRIEPSVPAAGDAAAVELVHLPEEEGRGDAELPFDPTAEALKEGTELPSEAEETESAELSGEVGEESSEPSGEQEETVGVAPEEGALVQPPALEATAGVEGRGAPLTAPPGIPIHPAVPSGGVTPKIEAAQSLPRPSTRHKYQFGPGTPKLPSLPGMRPSAQ